MPRKSRKNNFRGAAEKGELLSNNRYTEGEILFIQFHSTTFQPSNRIHEKRYVRIFRLKPVYAVRISRRQYVQYGLHKSSEYIFTFLKEILIQAYQYLFFLIMIKKTNSYKGGQINTSPPNGANISVESDS